MKTDNYLQHLNQQLLPFWKKAIDQEYGGVFTCFTNDGSELISQRKYIWSQGRFLWLAAKLERLQQKDQQLDRYNWNEVAEQTYHFLKKHALMENNHVVFAVERDGRHIPTEMDTSIFADCFYVLGCNAYAAMQEDHDIFRHALSIYQTIKKRIAANTFKSEPYPIPEGYQSHSIPMILLNVAQELFETAAALSSKDVDMLHADQLSYLNKIIDELTVEQRIMEMKHIAGTGDTLLERHVNPGHTLESIWFMIHSLQLLNQQDPSIFAKLEQMARFALDAGWDLQYGGLLRFVDHSGGKPHGTLINTPYEQLIMDTWDMKLWWPHAEALYTTKLLAELTNKPEWEKRYQQMENYTLSTFPNPNQEVGEWIQIRSRNGTPHDKVVALPVKDPFHIIRSFILLEDIQKVQ